MSINILGATTYFQYVGKLMYNDTDDIYAGWYIGNGYDIRPLSQILQAYDGRNVSLQWVRGVTNSNVDMQSGRICIEERDYRLLPWNKTTKIPMCWGNDRVILNLTVTDPTDPNQLTVFGHWQGDLDVNIVSLASDCTVIVDLAQQLTTLGFLGPKMEVRILGEERGSFWKKAILSLNDLGGLMINGCDVANFVQDRFEGPNGDRSYTNFYFKLLT